MNHSIAKTYEVTGSGTLFCTPYSTPVLDRPSSPRTRVLPLFPARWNSLRCSIFTRVERGLTVTTRPFRPRPTQIHMTGTMATSHESAVGISRSGAMIHLEVLPASIQWPSRMSTVTPPPLLCRLRYWSVQGCPGSSPCETGLQAIITLSRYRVVGRICRTRETLSPDCVRICAGWIFAVPPDALVALQRRRIRESVAVAWKCSRFLARCLARCDGAASDPKSLPRPSQASPATAILHAASCAVSEFKGVQGCSRGLARGRPAYWE